MPACCELKLPKSRKKSQKREIHEYKLHKNSFIKCPQQNFKMSKKNQQHGKRMCREYRLEEMQ